MTAHHVGARPQLAFRANYFAQGGDAASGARSRAVTCMICMSRWVALGTIVPLCARSFRASPGTPAISTFSPCLCGWGQGQLVCHSFVIALGVGEHQSPNWKDF